MERMCTACEVVENEIHFLIDCDRYKLERIEIFNSISNEFPGFKDIIDSKAKFILLTSQENEEITKLIASCICDWLKTFIKSLLITLDIQYL